jgi:hypothetical protein
MPHHLMAQNGIFLDSAAQIENFLNWFFHLLQTNHIARIFLKEP